MSVIKQFTKYTSLNILAMLGMSCYILADTFFISAAEGADGLTALNLVLPIYSVIFAIGSMLGTGSATKFSILRAGGDERADRYFSETVVLTVVFGLVFVLIGALFAGELVQLLGGDAHIAAVGESYTRTFMLFSPFFMLNYVFCAFARNDGAPSIAMAATITSSLSNVLLDYVFMFPLEMGMTGAALATGLSPIISILVCLTHFCSKKCTVKLRPAIPSLKVLAHSCRLGVSAFVGEMSSGVTAMVFNFIILGIAGNIGVAAYGVVANFAIVAVSVFNGIAQGAQPLVSSFYGAGAYTSCKKVLKLAIITALTFAALIVAAVMIFAQQFTALFNSEGSAQLAQLAENGMRLYFTGYIFAGFNIVGISYLSAVDRAGYAFIGAICRGFAAIVGSAFLLSALIGLNGVWLAFPVSELITAVLTIIFIAKCNRRFGVKSYETN